MSDLLDDDGRIDKRELGRRTRSGFAVVLALVVLIGGGIWVGKAGYDKFMAWRQTDDYLGTGKDDATLTIPSGATVNQIGQIAVQGDIVRSVKAFKAAAAKEPKSTSIQPGTYKVKTQLPADLLVKILIDPANKIVKRVTITEGLRLTQIVPVLVKGTGIPQEKYDAALKSPQDLGLPAYANNNPEGMLFPDTYEVPDKADATTMLKAMSARYAAVTADVDLENRAKALGLTPYQVIIVASIIEAEVNRDEDRPKVARAIYNRLAKNMPLQLDTTVNFALGRSGHVHLNDGDVNVDSPYNTYKNNGLPPGPIDSPSRKSIEAALAPVDGDWLYWVVVNPDTGETQFSVTLDEHNQGIALLNKWCQAHKGRCS